MFDFVRKHTKIMMFVMFLLIIPSFVLFGIDGYSKFREKGEVVAKVEGYEITKSEWDAAHKSEADRLSASMPNLDVKLLDSPEARYASLERLIRERVLALAADKFKLATSDARLARELQENPTIASLRMPDGKLDMDRYRQLAATQNLTPAGFEARVRQDLSLKQVEAGILNTGFAAATIADIALNAFFEKREVQLVNFSPAEFAAKVVPSDEEMNAFYEANKAMFQAPERVNIEYIVLDLDAVKKNISISESDLKSYYDQNAARLSGNEERRASHILINAAKTASATDRLKAKNQADELLQILRKLPDSFADLAKKNSQDTGSASNGGDLGYFSRGAMVKPFEDAAFAMKKGDISEVIESDFGYHIIKLLDIKTPKQRSFEELRDSMLSDLTMQQAQQKFAEAAEAFANGVYEQSDSLKPIADKLKLEIKTATNVMRKPDPAVKGVLSNEKFLAAVFGSDATQNKHNTEAVETAPSQLTAGRITSYTAARTLPFAEVRSIVRERVVAVHANELAKKEGLDKLAAWEKAPASAAMPASMLVSRDQTQGISPQVIASIMSADASTLPKFIGVELGGLGYAVVKINKIVPRSAVSEATAKQERSQYAQSWTSAEMQAYYTLLMERFKVEILAARPAKTPN